jgi:hypothetical protein
MTSTPDLRNDRAVPSDQRPVSEPEKSEIFCYFSRLRNLPPAPFDPSITILSSIPQLREAAASPSLIITVIQSPPRRQHGKMHCALNERLACSKSPTPFSESKIVQENAMKDWAFASAVLLKYAVSHTPHLASN